MPKFIELDGVLEKVELACTKTDGTIYDFNRFFLQIKFITKFHNYETTLNKAIKDQTKLRILISNLNGYNSASPKKVKEKKRVLESAKKLSDARDEIIGLFEKATFPHKGHVFKTKIEESAKKLSDARDEIINLF